MLDYQKRIVEEKEVLDVKLDALSLFIERNQLFLELDKLEKQRLSRQRAYMQLYSEVLAERIENF